VAGRWHEDVKPLPIEQIMKIQSLRTPRARAMDERKLHSRVIDPSDPRVRTWVRQPSRYDVLGVDTPPWYTGGITSTPKKSSRRKATKKKSSEPLIKIPEIKPPKIELPSIQTTPPKRRAKPPNGGLKPPKIELPSIKLPPPQIAPPKAEPPKKHGHTKEELVRRIKITGGGKGDKERIREIIKNNFSNEELKIINNGLRAIRITSRLSAGGRTLIKEDTKTHEVYAEIKIRKDYCNSPQVVVHELVHYLRAFDTRRRKSLLLTSRSPHIHSIKVGKATVMYTPTGADIDLEEAATEAEMSARAKQYPFSWFATGYWRALSHSRDVHEQDLVSKEYEVEDRATLTYRKAKRKYSHYLGREVATPDVNKHLEKGGAGNEKAMEAVLKRFKDTHISHLNVKGRVEAIDQYYTLVGKDSVENIHIYSPDAVKVVPRAKRGRVLYEWRDGRKYRIKGIKGIKGK